MFFATGSEITEDIKPKLSVRHKLDRLRWVINEYDQKKRRFGNNYNTCHGDEKWFYLLKDGTVCRVFPRYEKHPDGSVEMQVSMPNDA